jgi:hypothetical protein
MLCNFTGLLAPWPSKLDDRYTFGSGESLRRLAPLTTPSVNAEVPS